MLMKKHVRKTDDKVLYILNTNLKFATKISGIPLNIRWPYLFESLLIE